MWNTAITCAYSVDYLHSWSTHPGLQGYPLHRPRPPLLPKRSDLTNEQCDDVHVVDRNASATPPAKFLVVLTKDKGAPALLPAQ